MVNRKIKSDKLEISRLKPFLMKGIQNFTDNKGMYQAVQLSDTDESRQEVLDMAGTDNAWTADGFLYFQKKNRNGFMETYQMRYTDWCLKEFSGTIWVFNDEYIRTHLDYVLKIENNPNGKLIGFATLMGDRHRKEIESTTQRPSGEQTAATDSIDKKLWKGFLIAMYLIIGMIVCMLIGFALLFFK